MNRLFPRAGALWQPEIAGRIQRLLFDAAGMGKARLLPPARIRRPREPEDEEEEETRDEESITQDEGDEDEEEEEDE